MSASTITLQSLQLVINQVGAQLGVFTSQFTDLNNRLTTDEGNITALLNPPTGVPTPLLNWFAVPNTITSIDTTLNTTINSINASITTLTNNNTTLTNNLATETTNRINGDSNLQTQINTLTTNLNTTNANLATETSGRSTAASSLQANLDAINTSLSGTASQLTNEISTRANLTTSLNSQIATINTNLTAAQTQINYLSGIGVDPLGSVAAQLVTLTATANNALSQSTGEATLRANADIVLQNQINSISTLQSTHDTQIQSEVTARVNAINSLTATVNSQGTNITANAAAITAETNRALAAESTLTTNVNTVTASASTNASAITTETNRATAAEGVLTTNVNSVTTTANTASTNVTTLQGQMTTVQGKFGLIKNVSGYITGFQDNAAQLPVSSFFIFASNNDAKFQNPLYLTKYFPPVGAISFAPPTNYSTQYGGATQNTFFSLDSIAHIVNVQIFTTNSIGINGSVMQWPNYSTGGSAQRIGNATNTFLVSMGGFFNRYLSLWYRTKTSTAVTTGTWNPVTMIDNASNVVPGARNFEYGQVNTVLTITTSTPDQVLEFGVTSLTTANATIGSTTAGMDSIYSVYVSVIALNVNGI